MSKLMSDSSSNCTMSSSLSSRSSSVMTLVRQNFLTDSELEGVDAMGDVNLLGVDELNFLTDSDLGAGPESDSTFDFDLSNSGRSFILVT